MAGRPGLKLLAAGVLLAHLVALDQVAGGLQHGSVLKPTATPMFTRLLKPEEPPPVAAPPQPPPKPPPPRRARMKPLPEVAMPAPLPDPLPERSVPETVTPTVVAQEPPPPVAAPEPVASPPDAAASAALANWPVDTRVSYRLTGNYRGELFGDARVQWQRDGASYQVRLDADIPPFVTVLITSQGEVTDQGLAPRAYEEAWAGRRRGARFGERALQLEGGKTAPRPEGMQDTASQFVELSYRFATGRAVLEVGKTVSFWMARPGAVDLWTYDIVEREVLQTPQLGAVEAFRLKPRPIANPRGKITVEMWFAPALQYMPVRIRLNAAEDNFIDLLVEKIEQR
ncbi:MAG: DUF3108 domain-containing protein [Burkholderiales bacterium]|nr:DUF3108 domain-containing protein [Burkholderiales bacterium]